MARRKQLTNAEAAQLTVDRLRSAKALDDVDEATVQAFLSLAKAVDDPDAKADMWREYRAAIAALREVAAGGSDDDTTAFLVQIQTPGVRAKVGNAKKS